MKNICSTSVISNYDFTPGWIIQQSRSKKNYGPDPVGLDLKTKILRTGPELVHVFNLSFRQDRAKKWLLHISSIPV